ncbi:hypothetical protein TTHERM_00371220 (macronuclear) [Tetrahymena thermophila SB210]|uniref:Uncharacterized protein n=1 Tax=Tetrahymena thermophila (strain SB210) TaxID=312017 RepID=I7MHQ8_TETTS|nr:hypothetical protein TTHERM_00371220 [Tetrahymena thermophila SB210]EAR89307.2 hypothetical protein TTHERM_00371220 [Tetrahymena thermophila SB210]|eukprot:XP_001009552.2 hypothetical protein TTHERM_00371220 [Tetrahymena thermophila SB210]
MQQFVHFPVQMMIPMPIPYGIIQTCPNASGSPQPQVSASQSSSPQQKYYPNPSIQIPQIHSQSPPPKCQNKKISSASKKKDSSIEIIECPTSPFSASEEQQATNKMAKNGGRSRTSKKADKKRNEKIDNSNKQTPDFYSSTSLGVKVKSNQESALKLQADKSTQNQAASTPCKRVTRNSSAAASRSPDQEKIKNQMNSAYQSHHHSSSTQNGQHKKERQHNSPMQNFHDDHQHPSEVIIESDNTSSIEFKDCILVDDSVQEIDMNRQTKQKQINYKYTCDQNKRQNDQTEDIYQQRNQHSDQCQNQQIQKEKQNFKPQTQINNQIPQNSMDCTNTQSNNLNISQATNFLPSNSTQYYPCFFYLNNYNNGFNQNAYQQQFSISQSPLLNQQYTQLQDKQTHEYQNLSPQNKSSLQDKAQQRHSNADQDSLPTRGKNHSYTSHAHSQNISSVHNHNSQQESSLVIIDQPESETKQESVKKDSKISSARRTRGNINSQVQEINLDDKSKRTRKYNTFYNNGDFISGDYMFMGKKLTNKRQNPVQYNPILKKKNQRSQVDIISSSKSLQSSMLEIVQNNEKLANQKTKNLFLQSVKPSEIARASEKASKNVFTLPLSKRKPQRKTSDEVHYGSAFFFQDYKQKFIEEKFDEDTIFLVNNNNQNVEVKVQRTPLDKSVSLANKKTNGQVIDPLAKVSNKFDDCSRNKYFSQINFIKDYKSGYAPIEIQNQQEKELNEMEKNEQQNEETHKQHFIRRKQTNNINLKRSCGVSYVKMPESKQENVSDIYERLPQLVFQCSNGQPKLMEHEYFYEKLYQKIFTSSTQWLLCTQFESEDECLMRDYLLYPEKRWELCKGKYFVVKTVSDIWPLFIEKYFLCIHFFFDSKELIKCPQLKDFSLEEVQNIIKYSNIQLGLLFKKSINGKKAFKKSLGEAFLGEIENHPSSREPQQAKKKGRKSKPVENQIEEKNEDKKTQIVAAGENQLNMNKNQINKFFKEVKNKLKQDKFLNELPIFKKKIEDIQKYLLPYMKKLTTQETVMPSQEVIKSISELETNEEKVEAILEMMEFIQEQINDEDYQIGLPQKETKQKTSAKKESLKKSNTNTPSLKAQNSQNGNEIFAQLLLNQNINTKKDQNSKNSSEVLIEVVNSDSQILNNGKVNLKQNPEQENKVEKIQLEEEGEKCSNDVDQSKCEQKTEDNDIKEEKEEFNEIEVKEEKIEIEESDLKVNNNETLGSINTDNQGQGQNEIQIEEEVANHEKIEIEKNMDSELSSQLGSPKIQNALKEIENLQQIYQETNQNAQNFDKLDKLNQESQKISCNSPIRDSTSQSLSNKLLNSPSQTISTISKDLTISDKPQNLTEYSAIVTEENTIPIHTQSNNANASETTKEDQKLTNGQTLEMKKESLICQEILNYIDKDISSKNINTLSAKLELYVEEKGWKGSSQLVKSLLSTFILYAKDQFEKLALEMMNTRFGIVRDEDEQKLNETLSRIRFINKNSTKRRQTYENYQYSTRAKWDFHENQLQSQNIENNLFSKKEIKINEDKLLADTEPVTIAKLIDKEEGYSVLKRGDLSMPLYYISTRDSFAFDLLEKITTCQLNGKVFNKIEYFFDPNNYPTNFKSFIDSFPDYRVGATLYTGFFTHQELMSIENSCYETEIKSFQRHYFPMTAQMTCTAQKIRRTKFFFGSRYIWTRQQLAEPHSFVGAGVRQDVSQPPSWMRRKVVGPLEQAGILPPGFINSLALNVYHDGKEGLAQHFDDATRFRQPIFTFKLFSDARLSFGSQLYGFCNSAFVIPMPRGSVLKLEENSYAANGIKHCVRPCDMAGKNATIIMRQMHHKVVNEAIIYDENVDLPTWISTLSSREDAVPYGDQKEIEAEYLMRNSGQNCS